MTHFDQLHASKNIILLAYTLYGDILYDVHVGTEFWKTELHDHKQVMLP